MYNKNPFGLLESKGNKKRVEAQTCLELAETGDPRRQVVDICAATQIQPLQGFQVLDCLRKLNHHWAPTQIQYLQQRETASENHIPKR